MFFRHNKQTLIGLDITRSAVKLIELGAAGHGYAVKTYATEPIPADAINEEKSIVDSDAVSEALGRAVKRAGTRNRNVALAISGDATITKTLQMPGNLTGSDLEDQIELRADQHIPFPMEEVSFDYEVIGPSSKEPEMTDVLLVATRTENVDQRVAAVEAAGLTARVVDVEAFALERACRLLRHQMPQAEDPEKTTMVAVVDCGATTTTFSVLEGLKVVYTRDFVFGGHQLTEEIMHGCRLSADEAIRVQKAGELSAYNGAEILTGFLDDMTQQVNRSLQFFLASGNDREQPEKILVCGGCANIPGAAEVIAEHTGIPAEVGDPLGRMKISSRARAHGVRADATALLIACGLALRSFD